MTSFSQIYLLLVVTEVSCRLYTQEEVVLQVTGLGEEFDVPILQDIPTTREAEAQITLVGKEQDSSASLPPFNPPGLLLYHFFHLPICKTILQ